ncbi:MAG: hypothetical protein AABX73_02060 [Nanoarchaeota archaeon]
MKIAVCGSMTFSPEMIKVGKDLREIISILTMLQTMIIRLIA